MIMKLMALFVKLSIFVMVFDFYSNDHLCVNAALKLLPRNIIGRKRSNNNPNNIFTDYSDDSSELEIDKVHMKLAIDQARRAYDEGEVPIGAIVTIPVIFDPDDESRERIKFHVIGVGHNMVEQNYDASAHAEMLAMRNAGRHVSQQNWRLLNATLYSTLEPCPMCLSAAQAFRIKRIVYAAPDLRLGAVETHVKLLEVAKHPFHGNMLAERIKCEICQERSANMMKQFFRDRRNSKDLKRSSQMLSHDVNSRQEQNSRKRSIFFQWIRPYRVS